MIMLNSDFKSATDRKGLTVPSPVTSTPSVFSPVLARSCGETVIPNSSPYIKPTPNLQPRNYSINSSVFSPLNVTEDSPTLLQQSSKLTTHPNIPIDQNELFSKRKPSESKAGKTSSECVKSAENYLNHRSNHSASKNEERNGFSSSNEMNSLCNGSTKIALSARPKKLSDASVQTDATSAICSCSSKSLPSSIAGIQADFIRSIFETSFEEFADRNRYDFRIFYSLFLKQTQNQEEKTDELLKHLSTIDILTKENERLRIENEKLKLLRFGK